MYSLRNAMLSDAEAMARVHVVSWRETYQGLLDNLVIDKFDVENRKKMWIAFLKDETNSQRAYVAVHSDKIVGIASWRETTDHVELLTLYVLSKLQRQGIGMNLFRRVENDANEKKKSLVVWVLDGNSSSIFYEKMGLKFERSEKKELRSTFVLERMYSNRNCYIQ